MKFRHLENKFEGIHTRYIQHNILSFPENSLKMDSVHSFLSDGGVQTVKYIRYKTNLWDALVSQKQAETLLSPKKQLRELNE